MKEIVIKLRDDDYQYIKDSEFENYEVTQKLYKAVYEGTVIPEGHGDLIDKNKLSKKKQYLFQTDNGAFPKSEWFIKADDLFSAQTIIPAHKEKEGCRY